MKKEMVKEEEAVNVEQQASDTKEKFTNICMVDLELFQGMLDICKDRPAGLILTKTAEKTVKLLSIEDYNLINKDKKE